MSKVTKKLLAVAFFCMASSSAFAVDGCKVLLCLAAPHGWRSVGECVPDMEKMFRDMMFGGSMPSCSFSSGSDSQQQVAQGQSQVDAASGNHTDSGPASIQDCPPAYLHIPSGGGSSQGGAGDAPYCMVNGYVSATVNGQLQTKMWWATDGTLYYETGPNAGTSEHIDPNGN